MLILMGSVSDSSILPQPSPTYDSNNQLRNSSLEDHERRINIAIHLLSSQDIPLLNMVGYLQRIPLSKCLFFGREIDITHIAINFDLYLAVVLLGLSQKLDLSVGLSL